MKIVDFVMEQIAQMSVWAGSDVFRWKMKNVGWTGWGVSGVDKEPPEEKTEV